MAVIFMVGFTRNSEALISFCVIWCIGYCLLHLKQKLNHSKKSSRYKDLIVKYNIDRKIYEKQLDDYERQKSAFQKDTKYCELRRQKRLVINKRIFSKSRRANVHFDNPILGRSEKDFLQHLKNQFGSMVTTDRVIEIFNDHDDFFPDSNEQYSNTKIKSAYSPDFIVHHEHSGLWIDVEIDEPYTYDDEPIHYLDCENDLRRNKYFTDRGWIVIRFTERQVSLYPQSCCKEIAFLLCFYTGDCGYLKGLEAVPHLTREPKWSSSTARHMATQNYRSNYRPYPQADKIKLYGEWIDNDYQYNFQRTNLIIKNLNTSETFEQKISFRKAEGGRYVFNMFYNGRVSLHMIHESSDDRLILTEISTMKYKILTGI